MRDRRDMKINAIINYELQFNFQISSDCGKQDWKKKIGGKNKRKWKNELTLCHFFSVTPFYKLKKGKKKELNKWIK